MADAVSRGEPGELGQDMARHEYGHSLLAAQVVEQRADVDDAERIEAVGGIVQYDEPGLLVTLEEFPFSLMRDASSHGWDLAALEEVNKLRIVFTSPRVFMANLESPTSPLGRLIREWGVRRVVAPTYEHNRASRRVMEKLGMALVRRFRLTPDEIAGSDTNHAGSLEVWDGDDVENAVERAEWQALDTD